MRRRHGLAAITAASLMLVVFPVSGRAAGWLPAKDVSSHDSTDSETAVAMAANGASVVTWTHEFRTPSTRDGVQYRYEDADGTRHDVVTPNGVPSSSAQQSSSRVAMASDGRAILVWVAENSGAIQYQLLDAAGEPVGSPQNVPASNSQTDPDVGMAADGSALIVWEETDGNNNAQLRSVHIAPDGTAGSAQTAIDLPDDTADEGWFFPTDIRVAVAPDGKAVATAGVIHFTQNPCCSSTIEIEAVRFAADGTPSSTVQSLSDGEQAETPSNVSYNPTVGIDDAGNATVEFVVPDATATNAILEARRVLADDTLGPVREFATEPQANLLEDFSTAVAPDGQAVVTWLESPGTPGLDVHYGFLDATGAQTVQSVTLPAANSGDNVFAAFGRDGTARVVWGDEGSDAGYSSIGIDAAGATVGTASPVGPRFPFIEDGALAGGTSDFEFAWGDPDANSSEPFINSAVFDGTAPAFAGASAPDSGAVDAHLAFGAHASDRSAVTYAWDFGDGSNSTDAVTSHAYAAAGTFHPELVATDAVGNASVFDATTHIFAADSDGDGIADPQDCAPNDPTKPFPGGPDADCDGVKDSTTVQSGSGQTTGDQSGGGSSGQPSVDRPPTVALRGPRDGARLSTRVATPVAADASDDHGVAAVTFFLGAHVVCRDTTAPYTCAITPTGADVGRTDISAVATDTAGQVATADRLSITVGRFTPKSLSVSTRAGAQLRSSGRLTLPAGVTPAEACAGRVRIFYRSGSFTKTVRVALSSSCRYSGPKVAAPAGKGSIVTRVQFQGNDVLNARAARRLVTRR